MAHNILFSLNSTGVPRSSQTPGLELVWSPPPTPGSLIWRLFPQDPSCGVLMAGLLSSSRLCPGEALPGPPSTFSSIPFPRYTQAVMLCHTYY